MRGVRLCVAWALLALLAPSAHAATKSRSRTRAASKSASASVSPVSASASGTPAASVSPYIAPSLTPTVTETVTPSVAASAGPGAGNAATSSSDTFGPTGSGTIGLAVGLCVGAAVLALLLFIVIRKRRAASGAPVVTPKAVKPSQPSSRQEPVAPAPAPSPSGFALFGINKPQTPPLPPAMKSSTPRATIVDVASEASIDVAAPSPRRRSSSKSPRASDEGVSFLNASTDDAEEARERRGRREHSHKHRHHSSRHVPDEDDTLVEVQAELDALKREQRKSRLRQLLLAREMAQEQVDEERARSRSASPRGLSPRSLSPRPMQTVQGLLDQQEMAQSGMYPTMVMSIPMQYAVAAPSPRAPSPRGRTSPRMSTRSPRRSASPRGRSPSLRQPVESDDFEPALMPVPMYPNPWMAQQPMVMQQYPSSVMPVMMPQPGMGANPNYTWYM